MQSKTGFPSSHHLKSYVAPKSRLNLLGVLSCQRMLTFLFTLCISALLEFNQSLLDLFNLFDSRLIFMLLYDFINLVINAFALGLLGGMVQ